MERELSYAVLGPLVVSSDVGDVRISGARRRSLLLRLLVSANHGLSADRLIEDLWEGGASEGARSTLQSHISFLRRQLGTNQLIHDAGGYQLTVGHGALDSHLFEAETKHARNLLSTCDFAGAGELLTSALGRWRGDALADANAAFWAIPEVSRLEELHAATVEALLDALLAQGRNDEVIERARGILREQPLREKPTGHLMLALYRSGRQAEALTAYQDLRTRLVEELGLEPTRELADLDTAIVVQKPELDWVSIDHEVAKWLNAIGVSAPDSSGPVFSERLASPSTDFVGRSEEHATENVAILFTDVVGSTEASQRLSAEGADDVRRSHFSILRRAIAETGGREVKNLGDGLMVVFASTSAALACAVTMQQGVELSNRVSAEAVGLRVGLSVGEAAYEDGDYFGDPVVEAARLCARAEGGQVLATDFVRAMAGRRNRHECTSLGALTLKGLSEPVESVEVQWEPVRGPMDGVAVPLPSRLAIRPDVGVLGRAAETESIAQALKTVASGGQHEVVLVSGEPGLGKTTLVAEASRAAYDAGAIVLLGHSEEDLATPYQLFAEALGHYVTHAPDEVLLAYVAAHGSELARLVPALDTRIPDLPTPRGSDADTERSVLFAAVMGLLAAASEHQPIVLVLDDIQWADKDSLALLRHLAGSDVPLRLLILGTYRASERSVDALTETLAALHRLGGVARIELRGLDDAGVEAFMEAAAGHELGEDAVGLAHAISRETDGNPFFVTELLRNLVETGAIAQNKEGLWEAKATLDAMTLPDSVREVIGARVLRLGEEAGRILSLAAVIGRDFDLDLLAVATNSSEDDVLDVLDAASAVALVREVSGASGRFSFAHALIQRTLYEDLGPTRRARTHRNVAEALDSRGHGAFASRVFELAHHWQLGARQTDTARVIDAFRKAAERSVELTAFDEAVQWYSEAVERSGADGRGDLLLALGVTQIQANTLQQGRAKLREAAELVDDPTRLTELALAYNGPTRATHRDPFERSVLERALAANRPTPDVALRARLLAQLSDYCYDDDPDKLKIAKEAVALAIPTGDPGAIYAAYKSLFWSLFGRPQHADEVLAVTDSTVSAADQTGDLQAMAEARTVRFLARCQVGDRTGADQDRVAHFELSEGSGLVFERAWTRHMQAGVQINSADFGAAESSTAGMLKIAGGDDMILKAYGVAQIEILRWKGEADGALKLLDLAGPDPPPDIENYLRVWRAVVLSESAHASTSRGEIEDLSVEGFRNLTGVGSATRPLELAALADVACAQMNRELGASVMPLLLDWSGLVLQIGHAAAWGPCDLYLGKLARLLGDCEGAVRQLEGALRLSEDAGLTTWTLLTSIQLSAALAERRYGDDAERSDLLAEEALARARHLGLNRVLLEFDPRLGR